MARLVGIDIRHGSVRAALLRVAYRRVILEQLSEVDIVQAGGLSNALSQVVAPLAQHGESLAVALEGERCFLHRLTLPSTAARQLDEILPFELEAQLPIDFDELVYDHRLLARNGPEAPLVALCAVANLGEVKELISLVQESVGREPERISSGALALGNLVELYPELAQELPVAVLELSAHRSELTVLQGGKLVFARTLSRGTAGLPDEGEAAALAHEIRQTLMGWLAQSGEPVAAVWLTGAAIAGAEQFLSYHLKLPVTPLPQPNLEGITDDQRELLPSYMKAIGLALGLRGGSQDLDLRQGELSFQRGYGFLKERLPVLSGLAVTILVFFFFSSWAEMRTLDRDKAVLEEALSSLTEDVLGTATNDAEEIESLINGGPKKTDDPMPHMDAFDVIVEVSKAVPHAVIHDIAEFDMQRGHVKLNAIVGSTDEAQNIQTELKSHRCFQEVKISKISQLVNSDRQKYALEFDVLCPEDPGGKKKKKKKKAAPTKEKTE